MDVTLRTNPQLDQAMSALEGLQNKTKNFSEKDLEKLKKAAQDFEAMFIAQILKNMRRSLPKSGLFGDGLAGEFYTGMFDQNIANAVAGKGGFKLSDTLIRSLTGKNDGPSGMTLQDYKLRPIRKAVRPLTLKDWDRSIIEEAAKKYNVDPKLVQAVINVESANNPTVVSNKGAVGLMQLMKDTADSLGVKNRFDPKQNVFGGSKYLRMMLDRFDGDVKLALSAYNAGPAAVEEYNDIPPYKETQRYVEKVLNNYRAL